MFKKEKQVMNYLKNFYNIEYFSEILNTKEYLFKSTELLSNFILRTNEYKINNALILKEVSSNISNKKTYWIIFENKTLAFIEIINTNYNYLYFNNKIYIKLIKYILCKNKE